MVEQSIRLCASIVCRNELSRYLPLCLDNLLCFCDMVAVLDDGSDDGTREFLIDHPDKRVHVFTQTPKFFEHEGRTRQSLLVDTLALEPTHVLNVDCDELVDDGPRLRRFLEQQPEVPVWSLIIEEAWKLGRRAIQIREDGGWRSHPLNVLWTVPSTINDLRIMDRRLACRRVPTAVWQQAGKPTGVGLLHFGWANPAERRARYDRYTRHDNGRFHASSHLRSIMLPENKMRFRRRGWPAGAEFDQIRERLADNVSSFV
jgi:Glycosyl transferase family 2